MDSEKYSAACAKCAVELISCVSDISNEVPLFKEMFMEYILFYVKNTDLNHLSKFSKSTSANKKYKHYDFITFLSLSFKQKDNDDMLSQYISICYESELQEIKKNLFKYLSSGNKSDLQKIRQEQSFLLFLISNYQDKDFFIIKHPFAIPYFLNEHHHIKKFLYKTSLDNLLVLDNLFKKEIDNKKSNSPNDKEQDFLDNLCQYRKIIYKIISRKKLPLFKKITFNFTNFWFGKNNNTLECQEKEKFVDVNFENNENIANAQYQEITKKTLNIQKKLNLLSVNEQVDFDIILNKTLPESVHAYLSKDKLTRFSQKDSYEKTNYDYLLDILNSINNSLILMENSIQNEDTYFLRIKSKTLRTKVNI